MTLKELAEELLQKYETAELSLIWEMSFDTAFSERELKKEIEDYRRKIEEAERSHDDLG